MKQEDRNKTARKLKRLASQAEREGYGVGASVILEAAKEISEDAEFERAVDKQLNHLRDHHSTDIADHAWATLLSGPNLKCQRRRTTENYSGGSTCWFCDKNPAVDKHAASVEFHTKLFDGAFVLLFDSHIVRIPRCESCFEAEESGGAWGCLIVGLGGVGGIAISLLLGAENLIGWVGGGLLIGLAVGAFFGIVVSGRVTRGSGMIRGEDEWPAVIEAKARGLEGGLTPSGADENDVFPLH